MSDTPFGYTSNGWSPIEHFDLDAEYASGPFLVYLPDGRWNEGWIENGKFVGEWRFIDSVDGKSADHINRMEPIAFMVLFPPNPGELAEIISQKAA